MALIFMDGFDHYLVADITLKWNSTDASAIDIRSDYAVRPGSMGLLLAGGASSILSKSLPGSYGTFTSGFYWRTGSTGTASTIVAYLEGTTEHVSLRYDNTGHLTFTRAGTVLATSTNTFSINTWYHIEVKATIADSPSGAYEVRVNGSATNWIAATTGADTRNGGTGVISTVRLTNRNTNDTSSTNHRFDDFYFLDNSGSVANSFIGPSRITTLRPESAGNYTQWTGNYADNFVNVQDQTQDGDTTFNQTVTDGNIDTFNLDTVQNSTVYGVQHVLVVRQDAGSGKTVRAKTRISGTDYSGTTTAIGATYIFVLDPRSTSPASSAQWTASEINGAEFGYEKVS